MKWKRNLVYRHDSPNGAIWICYPRFETEFDVQHQLVGELEYLCNCLDNGAEVKTEVTVICDDHKCRFDVMMFKNTGSLKRAIVGIEVKRAEYKTEYQQDKKQAARYRLIEILGGIKTLYCRGIKDIPAVVAEVSKIIT